MKFRVNGEDAASWPNFLWRHEGRFLLRLKAIDLQSKQVMFYPVYVPLFEVASHGGQWMLDVFLGNSLVLKATLQKRAPFIGVHLHRTKVVYDD